MPPDIIFSQFLCTAFISCTIKVGADRVKGDREKGERGREKGEKGREKGDTEKRETQTCVCKK